MLWLRNLLVSTCKSFVERIIYAVCFWKARGTLFKSTFLDASLRFDNLNRRTFDATKQMRLKIFIWVFLFPQKNPVLLTLVQRTNLNCLTDCYKKSTDEFPLIRMYFICDIFYPRQDVFNFAKLFLMVHFVLSPSQK